MKMLVRERVKMLLAQENMTMKELAFRMQEISGKTYSLQNLSHRLKRGSVTFNEVIMITDILGYDIEFKKS